MTITQLLRPGCCFPGVPPFIHSDKTFREKHFTAAASVGKQCGTSLTFAPESSRARSRISGESSARSGAPRSSHRIYPQQQRPPESGRVASTDRSSLAEQATPLTGPLIAACPRYNSGSSGRTTPALSGIPPLPPPIMAGNRPNRLGSAGWPGTRRSSRPP